jgi:hypothetical protein
VQARRVRRAGPGFEASDVGAGDSEEFRTKQRSETGEAFDADRVRMLTKPCLDEFVDLGEAELTSSLRLDRRG